jgi:hypothetical protein
VIGDRSNFIHLRRLSTANGLFEHCDINQPRPEHGYCTDDVARALVVVCREPNTDHALDDLIALYLQYLCDAQRANGRFANRRNVAGTWCDSGSSDDASGRALWALGTAATRLPDGPLKQQARRVFDDACAFRSPWPRATAMAVAGAADVIRFDPSHVGALSVLIDAAAWAPFGSHGPWPWPEARLSYANALLPQTLVLIGEALDLTSYIEEGLRLLQWLISTESSPMGWLSVTPVDGWAYGEHRPAFDQQPIEAATLAEAAAQAYRITGDSNWLSTITACAAWFLGVNDNQVVMICPDTGAGYDGLTPTGRNENQGAESSIAALSTMQHFRHLRTPLGASHNPHRDGHNVTSPVPCDALASTSGSVLLRASRRYS